MSLNCEGQYSLSRNISLKELNFRVSLLKRSNEIYEYDNMLEFLNVSFLSTASLILKNCGKRTLLQLSQ